MYAATFSDSIASGLTGSSHLKYSKKLGKLIQPLVNSRTASERSALCNEIQKHSRRELAAWRTKWANNLLEWFRNTKHLLPSQHRSYMIWDVSSSWWVIRRLPRHDLWIIAIASAWIRISRRYWTPTMGRVLYNRLCWYSWDVQEAG